MKRPLSVVILYYAGNKPDDEDTLEGVKGIEESLRKSQYPVTKIRVTKDNWQEAVQTPGDVVFNFVEDETWQLYTKVAYRLEALGRAQVGHDRKSIKYSIRKIPLKRRLQKLGISTPNFKIFTRSSTVKANGLKYPLIIKPSREHAGIGISQNSVVTNEQKLKKQVNYLFKHYPGEVIAEEYLNGREIHVTILGNDNDLLVLPLCEIRFGAKFTPNWSVYTYKAKWDKKSWEYWDARVDSPAKISSRLAKKIKKLAVGAYKAFELRDIVRIDVRVDKNQQPFLVDININPSLNVYDTEDATVASVKAHHWSYDHFIKTLLTIAYRRVYGHTLMRERK